MLFWTFIIIQNSLHLYFTYLKKSVHELSRFIDSPKKLVIVNYSLLLSVRGKIFRNFVHLVNYLKKKIHKALM